jgi:hypothetical protein
MSSAEEYIKDVSEASCSLIKECVGNNRIVVNLTPPRQQNFIYIYTPAICNWDRDEMLRTFKQNFKIRYNSPLHIYRTQSGGYLCRFSMGKAGKELITVLFEITWVHLYTKYLERYNNS